MEELATEKRDIGAGDVESCKGDDIDAGKYALNSLDEIPSDADLRVEKATVVRTGPSECQIGLCPRLAQHSVWEGVRSSVEAKVS